MSKYIKNSDELVSFQMDANSSTPLLGISVTNGSMIQKHSSVSSSSTRNKEQSIILQPPLHDDEPDGVISFENHSSILPEQLLLFSWTSVSKLFIVPALGGFLFGYDISATSFAILEQQETSTLVSTHAWVQGLIVAVTSAGALQGSFSIYYYRIADQIGRLQELRYSALLYILGASCEVFAGFILWPGTVTNVVGTVSSNNNFVMEVLALVVLCIGRLIYGYGIAFAMHGGPTYLAEMIPATVRGFFVSMKEASIVLGVLIGYVVGYLLVTSQNEFENTNNSVNGWKYTYACTLLISTPMYVITFAIPDSSRWLLMKGRDTEALASLRFVYNATDAQSEFNQIMRQQQQQNNDDELGSTSELWTNRSHRAPLLAGVGLVTLQQVTGQPSVLSYATPILRNAGLADSSSIYLALCKLIATIIAAVLVESFGRKRLLYFGNTCMLLSLLALSFTGSFDKLNDDSIMTSQKQHPTNNIDNKSTVLIALFVYISGYQFSFGPISWLIISEVFPLHVRGQAVAFSVQMNFLFNALVQFFVPLLQQAVGYNVTFGVFALFTAYRYVDGMISYVSFVLNTSYCGNK